MKKLTKREKAKRARLRSRLALMERIARNIDIDPVSDCWLWKKKLNKGHGVISVRVPGIKGPRLLYVHRVSWEVFRNRRMPKGRVAAHNYKCIAAHCCNWQHIRATTQSHNERDKKRAKKWRERTLYGPVLWPPTHTTMKG